MKPKPNKMTGETKQTEKELLDQLERFSKKKTQLLKDVEDLMTKANLYMEQRNTKDFMIYARQAQSTSMVAHKVNVAIHVIKQRMDFDNIITRLN